MSDSRSPVTRSETLGGVCYITLARPQVNAYDMGLMRTLATALADVDRDPACAVAVLRSDLPAVFSVGADVKAWVRSTDAENRQLVELARANANAMAASDKVFIAEINGHALGGGLELALACDLRFAAEGDYKIGLPEVKLGLMPGNGGTQRLLRLVGASRAFETSVTGESVSPEAAYRIGLFDRLVPPDELQAVTSSFAEELAAGAREAIVAIKRSIHDGAGKGLEDGLAIEAALSDGLYSTPDAAEGMRAFAERRPPRFGGDDMAR